MSGRETACTRSRDAAASPGKQGWPATHRSCQRPPRSLQRVHGPATVMTSDSGLQSDREYTSALSSQVCGSAAPGPASVASEALPGMGLGGLLDSPTPHPGLIGVPSHLCRAAGPPFSICLQGLPQTGP